MKILENDLDAVNLRGALFTVKNGGEIVREPLLKLPTIIALPWQ